MKLPWNLPLLLDGATGTELLSAGMPENACPELWTLEHPSVLIDLQQRYIQAGCKVLYAPTFGANRERLKAFGAENRVRELNRKLTALTKESVASYPKSSCLIAGCMSPTGLKPEPAGETPFAVLEDIYDEQAAALKEAGVDLLVCETMTSLNEARAALLAARKTDLPVLVTLTIDEDGSTLSGARLLPAVITLQALGAVAVGLNCSAGPSCMAEPLAETLRYAVVPLIAKPSTMTEGGTLSPAQFAREMGKLLDVGATIVGGCCGTTPEYMDAVREVLEHHPIVAPREIDTDACAVESEVLFLSDDLNFSEPIACDSDLADNLIEAEDVANTALIELTCSGDIDNLLESGNMSRLPLALHTDDALLLDEALHRFPGRLLVDSLCEIEKPLLEDIASRYGALVF